MRIVHLIVGWLGGWFVDWFVVLGTGDEKCGACRACVTAPCVFSVHCSLFGKHNTSVGRGENESNLSLRIRMVSCVLLFLNGGLFLGEVGCQLVMLGWVASFL